MKFYLEIEKPDDKYCEGCYFLALSLEIVEVRCRYNGDWLKREKKDGTFFKFLKSENCPLKKAENCFSQQCSCNYNLKECNSG